MNGFTANQRVESFERQYRVGQVYQLFCTFTNPPKLKRLILVSVEPSPLLLYINSIIPSAYENKSDLLNRQVLMRVADHPFMDHDSHIDCTKAITQLSKENIQGQVLSDMKRQLGFICETTKRDIIREIMRSYPLELRYKVRILAGLQEELNDEHSR